MGLFNNDESIDWYKIIDEYRAKIKKLEVELEAVAKAATQFERITSTSNRLALLEAIKSLDEVRRG